MTTSKILIVDDDRDFAHLLQFDIKRKGYVTVVAYDGEAGLEKAKQEKPDLIILDIKMPKMDGYTFVRRIKKEPELKDLPLIVLTSYEPMKDMFKLEGVQDYFVKSADMKGIMDSIEKNLKKTPS